MGTETNIQAVCFMESSLEKHYIAVCVMEDYQSHSTWCIC